MNDKHIDAFLKAIGTLRDGGTGKWAAAPCPLANWRHSKGRDDHPSFGISRGARTVAKCLNPECGFKDGLFALVMTIRHLESKQPSKIKRDYKLALDIIDADPEYQPLIAPEEENATTALTLFPETWLDQFEPAYTDHAVHPYLESRLVDPVTARRWDLRWDAKKQRICFPLRDFHGRLCGLHGRTVLPDVYPPYWFYPLIGKDGTKHTNVSVWTGEHLVDFDQPVLLVESVFDLARVYQIWPNVMTPRMAGIGPEALKRLDGASSVYTLFDNDKAGDAARAVVSGLKGIPVKHLSVAPYKDPGDAPFAFLSELLDINTSKLII